MTLVVDASILLAEQEICRVVWAFACSLYAGCLDPATIPVYIGV